MRFPVFVGPSYQAQSLNVDAQACVNWFPEFHPLGTGKEKEIASLVPTPGLNLLLTLDTSPTRGAWAASNGTLFWVAGNKLYSISSAWSETELGTLNSSTGPVSMADNGTYLVIVDGTDGYTWNMDTSTFAEITDEHFSSSDQVTYQDGYFIFNKSGTGQFFISGLNDVTFDGLDISSAEGNPDNVVGVIANNQNLFVFGKKTTEVFYNSGDADFPFVRIQGAVIDVGCSAAFSIQKILGELFWLGGDDTGSGIIYKMSGYQPVRISTPAIESIIRAIDQSTISNTTAWVYQQGGHAFYAINLPGVSSTWVFDVSTNLWHERKYQTLFGADRHRAQCHANAYGKNIVGDYEDGKVYFLDQTKYTDNGTSIIRQRSAPHFSDGLARIFHNSFQLDMETGVGLDGTGQGTNPQAILQWSDDGGHTWSDERWADIGAIGKKKTRVIWRRLGSARDRVYRVTIADPIKAVLIGAEIGVEKGAA